ncbi:hypothetical protein HYR69_10200 [Candidatus Sumerlaeota bacterium]|nr:hypothetical protein [Candidatus Sumerlaeota bacterium]
MIRRGSFIGGIRRSIPWAILIGVAALLSSCGGGKSAEGQAGEGKTESARNSDVERRIENIEAQIKQLEKLTESLKQDAASVDATREALAAQVATLRAEISGGEVKPFDKPSMPVKHVVAAQEKEEKAAKKSGGWFLTFVLFLVIIVSVFIIAKIFLRRWQAEDEEPMVEKTNDLGTVRYPAGSAGDSAPQSGSQPEAESKPPSSEGGGHEA